MVHTSTPLNPLNNHRRDPLFRLASDVDVHVVLLHELVGCLRLDAARLVRHVEYYHQGEAALFV